MLVNKTNFGSVIYNHANLYRFEETSSYWLVERISVFLYFSLVNHRHNFGIIVYLRTVTNIKDLCGPCVATIAGFPATFYATNTIETCFVCFQRLRSLPKRVEWYYQRKRLFSKPAKSVHLDLTLLTKLFQNRFYL